MPLGSVFIPAGPWGWPIGLVLVMALVFLFWSYRRSVERGAAHKVAFFLKILGLLLLALCLLEPQWSGKRAKSGANILLVVADNSSGMNVLDQGRAKVEARFSRPPYRTSNRIGWPLWRAISRSGNMYLIHSSGGRRTFRNWPLTAKRRPSAKP